MGKADELKLATPRIESIGDRRFLWADNVLLTNISTMLPFEWSNLKRLFDRRSTFEIRSGPFEYERIRIGFDDDLIRWTVSCGWWHPKTTTIYTDYGTTMRVLFEHGYDLWRKDNGIMDETDKAIRSLNESNIPSMRSTDPDHLVFEVGENVFRALLPADPMQAAGLLIGAVRGHEGIIIDYRKAIQGLGRFESLPAIMPGAEPHVPSRQPVNLTDDMVYMAVIALLCRDVGCTPGEADEAYRTWLDGKTRGETA